MELSERKQKILVEIIERYIAHAEPVGSKTLCEAFGNSVSSATIRNDMASLAELGFLEQPHASAGRIPSQKGYRYYVDFLMHKRELSEREQKVIKSMLSCRSGEPEQLLESASAVLAQITKCAALATMLTDEAESLSKVETVTLGRSTLLLVAVTSNGLIKNRVCRLDCSITESILSEFYAIVQKHFIGVPVSDISTVTVQNIAASLGSKAIIMSPLLITLVEIVREISETDIMLEGQSNLFESGNPDGIQSLMEFLSGKDGIKHIVSEHKHKLSVMIGSENPHKELENSSTIIARYQIDGSDAGALGIIGSTRIDYANLIPHIEYLTKLVGTLLSDTLE